MTAQAKTPPTESEDIDLLLLIERSILFFKRYLWVFVIALVAGVLLGLYFYRSLPTVYTSRMVVHSYILTNQEEIQVVGNWRNLLKKKEHQVLAEAFGCRPELLRDVKELKAEEIQKVYTPNNPNGFIIEVTITDNSILPELQKAIVYGFENSEYVSERLAVKRASLQELMDKTSIEIGKLDSTKQAIEHIITGTGRSPSSLILNSAGINRELIDMNEKFLSYKESLKFTNAIQVLQSFSQFKKPSGPKLFVWLFIGLVFCGCLAFVFTLFHSVRTRLKQRARLRNSGQQAL
jgi:hypothetical protein